MTARIPSENHTNAVEVTTWIKARPATVFRCFSDAALFSHWIGAPVSFADDPGEEIALGSKFRVLFSQGRTTVEGTVLELVPDQRVRLSWGISHGDQALEMPAGSTTVTIELTPERSGTLVRLRHEGLASEELRGDHLEGWTDYLRVLKTTAERV